MDFVKGIVKKYFRSYNRTLKDGTKKTYKTEQVQVTISKSENVFEDKQDVFIISQEQAEEIDNNKEMLSAYELFNSMLSEDNKKLRNELEEVKNELYSNTTKLQAFTIELDDNKNELDKSNKKLLVLKEDCSNLRDQLEESKATISNLKDQLDDKNFIISDLNENINGLNEKLAGLNNNGFTNNGLGFNPLNASLISNVSDEDSDVLVSDVKASVEYNYADYIELQREYVALLKKYEDSQENLYNEKVKVIHYKNLLDKFKSFILRLE